MLKHENCPAMIPATHLNLVYKIPYRRAHGLAFRPSARASKGTLHINLNHLIADVKNLGARKYHKSFRVISLRTVGGDRFPRSRLQKRRVKIVRNTITLQL